MSHRGGLGPGMVRTRLLRRPGITGRLGRSPLTVAREIDRNGGRDAYWAVDADDAARGATISTPN